MDLVITASAVKKEDNVYSLLGWSFCLIFSKFLFRYALCLDASLGEGGFLVGLWRGLVMLLPECRFPTQPLGGGMRESEGVQRQFEYRFWMTEWW